MLAKEVLKTVPRSIRVIRRLLITDLEGGISLQHLRLLVLIKEGMGQTQMAEVLQISLAAISKTVNLLVVKNLITKLPGEDRRSLKLSLTPKGKKTLASVTRIVEKKLEHGMAALSKNEKKKLSEGLMVLDKLMLEFK